jgi:hypothetical protein
MRPAAAATAIVTFTHPRHVPPVAAELVDVDLPEVGAALPCAAVRASIIGDRANAALPFAADAVGAPGFGANNCSSDMDANCLSILASSASQLRSVIGPESAGGLAKRHQDAGAVSLVKP